MSFNTNESIVDRDQDGNKETRKQEVAYLCSPASSGTHVGYITKNPDFRVLSR